MAQVTGASAAPPPASAVAGSRVAAGSRNVAAVDRRAVEEVSPKLGSALDDGAFLFGHYERETGERDRRHSPVPDPGHLLRTNSQTFVSALEAALANGQGGDGFWDGGPIFAGFMARAIRAYETNARVVGTAAPALGGKLSVSL